MRFDRPSKRERKREIYQMRERERDRQTERERETDRKSVQTKERYNIKFLVFFSFIDWRKQCNLINLQKDRTRYTKWEKKRETDRQK